MSEPDEDGMKTTTKEQDVGKRDIQEVEVTDKQGKKRIYGISISQEPAFLGGGKVLGIYELVDGKPNWDTLKEIHSDAPDWESLQEEGDMWKRRLEAVGGLEGVDEVETAEREEMGRKIEEEMSKSSRE